MPSGEPRRTDSSARPGLWLRSQRAEDVITGDEEQAPAGLVDRIGVRGRGYGQTVAPRVGDLDRMRAVRLGGIQGAEVVCEGGRFTRCGGRSLVRPAGSAGVGLP